MLFSSERSLRFYHFIFAKTFSRFM